MTDTIDITELLKRVKNIGDQLKNYTEKLVFSFVDIEIYRKVANNFRKDNVNYIEWRPQLMDQFAQGISNINKDWGLELGTCSEKIDLEKYNIVHNKCIDDLMIDLFSDGKVTKRRNLKDKGQREDCGCIMSKDIGQLNLIAI